MNYDYIVYSVCGLGMLWCLFGNKGILTKGHTLKQEQRTFCYCPACKVDLCSNDSLIYDHPEKSEVIYKCRGKHCGNVSWWNFDIAPFPVLIKSDEGSSDIKPREIAE